MSIKKNSWLLYVFTFVPIIAFVLASLVSSVATWFALRNTATFDEAFLRMLRAQSTGNYAIALIDILYIAGVTIWWVRSARRMQAIKDAMKRDLAACLPLSIPVNPRFTAVIVLAIMLSFILGGLLVPFTMEILLRPVLSIPPRPPLIDISSTPVKVGMLVFALLLTVAIVAMAQRIYSHIQAMACKDTLILDRDGLRFQDKYLSWETPIQVHRGTMIKYSYRGGATYYEVWQLFGGDTRVTLSRMADSLKPGTLPQDRTKDRGALVPLLAEDVFDAIAELGQIEDYNE